MSANDFTPCWRPLACRRTLRRVAEVMTGRCTPEYERFVAKMVCPLTALPPQPVRGSARNPHGRGQRSDHGRDGSPSLGVVQLCLTGRKGEVVVNKVQSARLIAFATVWGSSARTSAQAAGKPARGTSIVAAAGKQR
jgi:hypothetical protein